MERNTKKQKDKLGERKIWTKGEREGGTQRDKKRR